MLLNRPFDLLEHSSMCLSSINQLLSALPGNELNFHQLTVLLVEWRHGLKGHDKRGL